MKQSFKDLIIIIILIFSMVFLWFSKGLIFAGGEEGIPFYDLNKTTEFVSYSWQDVSAGYPTQLLLNRIPYFNFLKFFYLIGFPGFLIQALHFFFIMSFGAISFYFLLRETIHKELMVKDNSFKLVSLIGTVFYLLNPFSMTQIWGRGLYLQFFPFALFPFFLLMFILGLRSKNFIYGLLGLLASVFFAGSFGNPTYIFSLWIVIFIYLSYYIFINRSRKEFLFSLGYFLFMIVGWIVIQIWWIYPFIKISSNQFSSALNNWDENVGTLKGISKDYKIYSLLRLIHEGYYFRDQMYGSIYLSVPFFLLSWIIPIAAAFSYKSFKNSKFFLFFAGLFLFSLFICLGSNLPLGKLFIFIFKIFPPFQAFRNPFEKFGLVLTLAYAPFFAIGSIVLSQFLSKIFKKLRQKLFLWIILLLVFAVFLWPFWVGQFAGGVKISPWIKVPEYYREANDWLSRQNDDGRVIHFPINPGDGLRYSGWDYPYQGIEPGEYIFSRPAIGKNGQPFKLYYNVLLQRFNSFHKGSYGPDPDITDSEFRSRELFEELAKLNVRYIILHRDINPEIGQVGSWESVASYLKSQKNLKKINTFGKLDIYKVEIPDKVHLIYSPDVEVNYSKINTTLYQINVHNVKQPFDLYFLENFDANWEVDIDGQKVADHGKIFSYANRWKIKKLGSFSATLKYKPQDYMNEGMNVTKVAVLFGVFICAGYFLKKGFRK